MISATTVSFYDTLGEDAMAFILSQTQLITIFMAKEGIKAIFTLGSQKRLSNLKNIVLFEDPDQQLIEEASKIGIKVYSFWELVKEGKETDDEILKEEDKCNPETLATICYTSGTTGMPKV